MSEKLRLLILKQKIKHFIHDIQGICEISIEDNFNNYNIIYSEILKTYKNSDVGIHIDKNIDEIMQKNISKNNFYYISFEGIYFLKFKFISFINFIESWRFINKGYDLTLFNEKMVFVVNYNEDDVSIHLKKLESAELKCQ